MGAEELRTTGSLEDSLLYIFFTTRFVTVCMRHGTRKSAWEACLHVGMRQLCSVWFRLHVESC